MFECPLKIAARDAPSQLAFETTTFQQLDHLTDTFAKNLQAAGIQDGDRIAVRHPSSIEMAALFFATWRIGASICPIHLHLPLSKIESHLNRLQARGYIDSFPLSIRLRKRGVSSPFPGLLLFTSGSTSLPKIALLSLANLLSNAQSAIQHLDLRAGDRWLLNLPLYHVSGIGILIRCILARAHLILERQDPDITHISAVPTQLHLATPFYRKLRCLLIGGAPISFYPEQLPCYLSYGLTEMGSLVAARLNPPRTDAPFDVGLPLPGREVSLSFDGEILVRGDCLFQGYWEDGKILKPFDRQGWFATRDLGRLSSKGMTVLGRKDWQFISGGENIQPEEIEEALLSFPGVMEAAVVPFDDPAFGQRPMAILKAHLHDIAPLKMALLDRLPKFKIPVHFLLVDELPRSGLKVNRKALFAIANNFLKNRASGPGFSVSGVFHRQLDGASSGQKKSPYL